ncbi:MAG: O-antigen ligase family protein [Sphingomonadaceae bacterium]
MGERSYSLRSVKRPGHRQPGSGWFTLPVAPATILIYALLLPPELHIFIGPLRIGAYRLALIGLSPIIIMALLNGKSRLGMPDFLLMAVAFWMPLSFTINYTLPIGLEAGGSQSLDMLLAWLIGRTTIHKPDDLRRVLRQSMPGFVLATGFLLIESVTHHLYVRQTLQNLLGGAGETGSELRMEYRAGLLRAYSVFIHPIHAGIISASLLPLFALLFRDLKARLAGIAMSVCGLFSLSSAAVVGMIFYLALFACEFIQRRTYRPVWPIVLAGGATILLMIQMISGNGVIPLIYRYLTFNPATGHFRMLIWEYAGAEALRNPWFGIGYEQYTRPIWMRANSVDAHYLSMAVKYGLVPSLLYLLLAISIVVLLALRVGAARTLSMRNAYFALTCSIAVTLVLMFTVTFWGATLAWFNLLLGFSLSIALYHPRRQSRHSAARKPMPPRASHAPVSGYEPAARSYRPSLARPVWKRHRKTRS